MYDAHIQAWNAIPDTIWNNGFGIPNYKKPGMRAKVQHEADDAEMNSVVRLREKWNAKQSAKYNGYAA